MITIAFAYIAEKRMFGEMPFFDPDKCVVFGWFISLPFIALPLLSVFGMEKIIRAIDILVGAKPEAKLFIVASVILVIFGIASAYLMTKKNVSQEIYRKFYHIYTGAIVILLAYYSVFLTVVLIAFAIWLLIVAEYLRNRWGGTVTAFVKELFNHALREEERSRIYTASIFFAFSSCLSLMAFELKYAVAAISIIAFGDTFASLIGKRYGKHKWIYNKNKSIEGTIGGLVAVTIALVLFGFEPLWLAFLIAFVGMLFESLPFEIADNIFIPLTFVMAIKTTYSIIGG